MNEKIVRFDKILTLKIEIKVWEVKICCNEEVKDILNILISLNEQILNKRA